ncbi:MAG: ABC transporter ATP-binding protein/permease, partial [Proteobacteria bacterium]|nr:ABC transporter ATP-binding protein/permease [Pseudomonadota bacterium]
MRIKHVKIFKNPRKARGGVGPGSDKQSAPTAPFPKTLLGFYARFGLRPFARVLLLWAFLFFAVEFVSGVIFPLMQKWFIALFENHSDIATMWHSALILVGAYIGVFVVQDIFSLWQDSLRTKFGQEVQNSMGQRLLDYTNSQSMSFWTNRMPGKINQQINYIFGGFGMVDNFFSIFIAVVIMVLNTYLVLSINKWVALILLVALLFRLVFGIFLVRPMNKASKTASESSSHLAGKIMDSISNYSIIKLFVGAKTEREHLQPVRKKSINDRLRAGLMQRIFWGGQNIVWDVLFGVTMLFCVKLFIAGSMKVSEIVFTINIYFAIMAYVGMIVRQIPQMSNVMGSAHQSYKELIKPIEVEDVPNAPDLRVSHGKIEIRGLTFKYKRSAPKTEDENGGAGLSQTRLNKKATLGQGRPTKKLRAPKIVLDDLNLIIKPGEKVGLVGGSGAGKTTLVNLLMRFYDPTKGEILIDGQDIKMVAQDSLRENIAFIPQEPTMFNRTLRENIGYGRLDATAKEIRDAAKRASIDDFIMETEKKYESLVGDRGIKLSGGQRQRIAIARAFLKNAPILILDEATAALDSETEAAIQKSFEELSSGRTTIAIAHRLSTLRNMDRIIVIDHGKIVESGTHMQLLRKRGGIYAR